MPPETNGERKSDVTYEILEGRISYLEHLKAFHDEIVKIIRIFTSNESFTSQRCLQEIVNFIAKKFDIYVASLFLADEGATELTLYVSSAEEPAHTSLKDFKVPIGSGLTGTCAKAGETIIANDVTRETQYIRGPLPDTQSELCVAIKIKHRIAGVLDLQDRVRGRFRKDFARLIEDVALNIGFVLETQQLYENLRRYSEDLEKKVEGKVQELRKSEERYRAIAENSTEPMFTTDVEGRFTWANGATCARFGYKPQELRGMNISRLAKKGQMHKLFTLFREVIEGHEIKPVALEMTTKNGEERTLEVNCVAVREGERAVALEGTLRDVTDRTVMDKLRKNYMKSLEEAVIERTSEIKETQRAAILAIANLAESIDDDTCGHLERIRHYCRLLALDLKVNSAYKDEITDEYAEMIYDLSPLHDLGKVGIRDYILQKPDKLTDEEFKKMKDHAEIGARALHMAGEMIHRESIFSIGEMIARFHHEKWDGSGYPEAEINGEIRPLKGVEIPLCARIVALADVYDALTSKRPYKMPFPHEKARDMIVTQSGKHFDPEVVQSFIRNEQAFIRIREQYPDERAESRPFDFAAQEGI